jgi:hypothetical protein
MAKKVEKVTTPKNVDTSVENENVVINATSEELPASAGIDGVGIPAAERFKITKEPASKPSRGFDVSKVKPIVTHDVALAGSGAKPSDVEEQVRAYKKYDNKTKGKKDIAAGSENYPEHVRNLAFLMKNNSEIRRFTAIGIINYLLQKNEIKGEKRYVSFLWNKFQVKVDGLMKEYYYTEPFFLNCLVASFTSFSASAQKTINTFTKKEMMVGIDKAVDAAEVDEIVGLTDKREDNTTASE